MADAAAAASDVIVSITSAQQVLNSTTTDTTGSGHDVSNGEEGYGIKLYSPQRSIIVDTQLSPNLTTMSPASTPGKPPRTPIRYPSMARKQSLSRSSFSKPKSRLVEPSYPSGMTILEENVLNLGVNSPAKASPRASIGTPKASPTPITPKTPLMAAQGGDDDDDKEDEIYKAYDVQASKKGKKLNRSRLVEWTALLILVTLLVASITVDSLRNVRLWSLEIWKWCVLVLVVFCGRLVNEWLTNFLVFVIERNFVFKKKVLYFVYGMKKPVQYFFWLGFILLAWELLFNHGVDRSSKTVKILHHITMAIAGCLVGSGLWLVKTLLIKILAVSFHVNRFFDRIQESLFHQYILLTLSGPPQMEIAHGGNMKNSGRLSFISTGRGEKKEKEEVIDVDKLHKMNQGKVSAWTMKGLIKVVRSSGLTTISNTLDDDNDDDGNTQKEITSEWEAKVEAYKIFNNVAKPGHKYIEEEDLLRFMKKEEADIVLPLFEGATETGKIKRSALTKWVVNAYLDRKSLTHSLHDTKTAVEELNRMASVFVAIVIIIVWNLMMGFLTTKVLVLISSQLLLIVFMFGNTAKMIFEAIIFVFVMHPYDVGDRCVIDGVQMVVEEMNILTTIFLRYDNEKIIYPNSVLATKPISNFYRSPEMSDSVEFAIDFSTTMETISALKDRVKSYIESKPQHWKQGHSLQIKEIENMDRMKMALYVNHTINFQNAGEKGSRRCDLMWEMKKIFEDLDIKYHLLPQDIHVSYVGTPGSLH